MKGSVLGDKGVVLVRVEAREGVVHVAVVRLRRAGTAA